MKHVFLIALTFVLFTTLAFGQEVEIAWSDVSEATGYKVYYSVTSPDELTSGPGSSVDVGSDTETVLDLQGDVHYLAVTAYDDLGQESTLSNIVCTSWMPSLSYPADGTNNVPTDIDFEWTQPANPEEYTFTVYYGPVGGPMTEAFAIPTSSGPVDSTPIKAAIISFLLVLTVALIPRKMRFPRGFALCAISALLLTSCSGGGSGSGSEEYTSVTTTLGSEPSSAILEPDTTYAWKVVADNGSVQTESVKSTFTTAAQ